MKKRSDKKYLFEVVESSFKKIIENMDYVSGGRVSLTAPNFKDTPARVARAYMEIFSGLFVSKHEIAEMLRKTFPSVSNEMVQIGPVDTWTVCPHHFLPVHLHVWVAYIPDSKVIGLSKIPRLVEMLAKVPALQEDLTVGITTTLADYLEPAGVACLIRGRHLCVEMRGVKKAVVTTTTSLHGKFHDFGPRNEFLSAVRQDMPGGL